jgi:hypothetical protein
MTRRSPTGAQTPAAVTYIGLPVSSGGAHSLGRMSRRTAYQRTMEFVGACVEPIGPMHHRFTVLDVPGLKRDPGLAREVNRRFGDDVALTAERVPDALDFLDGIDPQPANQWGMAPIWFWVTSQFQILDPATGRPIPGQDPGGFAGVEYEWKVPLGTSGLRLILNNHASLGIELCIPDADDEVQRRVIPWLQQYLPFRFSPKHWRAWTPTKSGSFKARRLTLPGASPGDPDAPA